MDCDKDDSRQGGNFGRNFLCQNPLGLLGGGNHIEWCIILKNSHLIFIEVRVYYIQSNIFFVCSHRNKHFPPFSMFVYPQIPDGMCVYPQNPKETFFPA